MNSPTQQQSPPQKPRPVKAVRMNGEELTAQDEIGLFEETSVRPLKRASGEETADDEKDDDTYGRCVFFCISCAGRPRKDVPSPYYD